MIIIKPYLKSINSHLTDIMIRFLGQIALFCIIAAVTFSYKLNQIVQILVMKKPL